MRKDSRSLVSRGKRYLLEGPFRSQMECTTVKCLLWDFKMFSQWDFISWITHFLTYSMICSGNFLSIPTTTILVCSINFFKPFFLVLKCVVGSEEGIRPPAEPELQALWARNSVLCRNHVCHLSSFSVEGDARDQIQGFVHCRQMLYELHRRHQLLFIFSVIESICLSFTLLYVQTSVKYVWSKMGC